MIGRRGLLAVAAGAALPIDLRAPGAGGDAAGGPDAELVRLCAEHLVNYAALNSDLSDLDDEHNPRWIAYRSTLLAIDAAKPQTLAGMVAKAVAAQREAQLPGGGECYESCVAGRWAWDLLHDLMRLHGGCLMSPGQRGAA